MQTIKKYWKKFVLGIAAILAAFALAYLVFKKHITGEVGDFFESEAATRRAAKEQQEREQARLEKEKQEAERKAEEERKQKEAEAERQAKEEKKRLRELEKKDKEAFKEEINRDLGIKEKKRRGRPKRDE